MDPIVSKSIFCDMWYIVTKYKKDNDLLIADGNSKYQIPKKVIERIAYDHFFETELKGYENGYSRVITIKDKGDYRITIEKV